MLNSLGFGRGKKSYARESKTKAPTIIRGFYFYIKSLDIIISSIIVLANFTKLKMNFELISIFNFRCLNVKFHRY